MTRPDSMSWRPVSPTSRAALEKGETTAVELLDAYLARIEAYDRPDTPTALNAMVVMNPRAREEAEASDARRARGETLGPLDGIPYTAKDSYLAKGLTAASGSPAFAHLVAQRDAFAIERLRAGGAVLIGLTNMPPMANGGDAARPLRARGEPVQCRLAHQRLRLGLLQRLRHGDGGVLRRVRPRRETWSSGRAPASNNALCAYTPSRGVISVAATGPSYRPWTSWSRTPAPWPTCSKCSTSSSPTTRTRAGTFGARSQRVALPPASQVRPASYPALAPADTEAASDALAGKRVGVPGCTSTPTPTPERTPTEASAARPGSASTRILGDRPVGSRPP